MKKPKQIKAFTLGVKAWKNVSNFRLSDDGSVSFSIKDRKGKIADFWFTLGDVVAVTDSNGSVTVYTKAEIPCLTSFGESTGAVDGYWTFKGKATKTWVNPENARLQVRSKA